VGGVERALGRRQVVEPLEHGVDDRPARGRGRRRLRQPVDRAEPEQQRARHEVTGTGRRQRAQDGQRQVESTGELGGGWCVLLDM
jgi:hypothetical protein